MNDAAFKAHNDWLALLRIAAGKKCGKDDPAYADYLLALDNCNAARVYWLKLMDPVTPWTYNIRYDPRGTR